MATLLPLRGMPRYIHAVTPPGHVRKTTLIFTLPCKCTVVARNAHRILDDQDQSKEKGRLFFLECDCMLLWTTNGDLMHQRTPKCRASPFIPGSPHHVSTRYCTFRKHEQWTD